MTQDPLSDEEIIAQERSRYRRARRTSFWIMIAWMAAALLIVAADASSLLIGVWRQIATVLIFISLFVLLVLNSWRNRPSKEAFTERIIRKHIDDYHARYRYLLSLFLFSLMIFANNAASQVRPPFGFVALVLFSAFLVALGPGFPRRTYFARLLNDELTLVLRGKSILVGYLVVLVLLGGLNIATFYSPALAIHLGPFLLVAGIAIPTLYFLFLQWQAGRGS